MIPHWAVSELSPWRSASRFCIWLCVVVLGATGEKALAHDPFEITSTARVLTNQIVLEIEMEFRTALHLAEIPVPPQPFDAAGLFSISRDQLRAAAGAFFQIDAGGNRLSATATNVTLGVEDHVQFLVRLPGSPFRPLRFVADGLRALEGRGQYGTTLTVLDMLNKRVMGQSVLYAASTPAEFSSRTNVTQSGSSTALIRLAAVSMSHTATNNTERPVKTESRYAPVHSIRRNLILGGLAIAAIILWSRKQTS